MVQAFGGQNVSDSAQINPGVVQGSDIANDAVVDANIGAHTTTKITVPTTMLSGTITEAQIADLAVALGKLKSQTQGMIIYFGAAGVASLLSPGAAGQFLKTNGAAANPSWDAAGGTLYTSTIATQSTDAETSTASTSYVKLREFLVPYAGNVNVYWEHKEVAGGGTATSVIYKNGSIVGVAQNSPGSTYTAYNESIAVAASDLIQIYGKHSNAASSVAIQNARIRASLVQAVS